MAWTLAKALATPLALFSTEAVHKSVDNRPSPARVLRHVSLAGFCCFDRQQGDVSWGTVSRLDTEAAPPVGNVCLEQVPGAPWD